MAIGDKVGNRPDLQAMPPRKGHKIIEPCHRPVIIHNLADHARRIEAGEPRNINRSLRMPCPHEHAAIARNQRKDVAGGHNIFAPAG